MGSRRSRRLGSVVAFSALAAHAAHAGVSRAAPTDAIEPVRITYEAPPSCPDEGFFFDQMRARTWRVRRAENDEPARQVAVSVTVEGASLRGRLDTRSASGETAVREVSGRKCEQVVSALAFVAALGVDPKASMTASDVPPEEPRVEPSEEPPKASPEPAAPDTTAPRPPRSVVRPRVVPKRTWSAEAGIDASTIVLLLPSPAWGGRAWIDLKARGPGSLPLSGRVSLGGFATVAHPLGPGLARFQLVTVRADGCPIHGPLRSAWRVEPCAFVEAGALFGQGVLIAAPKASVTGHLAAGPLGRLSFAPSASVRIGVEAALVFPLLRTRITFGERVAYEQPVWGVSVGIGVGMHFL